MSWLYWIRSPRWRIVGLLLCDMGVVEEGEEEEGEEGWWMPLVSGARVGVRWVGNDGGAVEAMMAAWSGSNHSSPRIKSNRVVLGKAAGAGGWPRHIYTPPSPSYNQSCAPLPYPKA